MDEKYAILGIHDERVITVEGNVARVRMFIGPERQVVDEDFPLPQLPAGVPPTEHVYRSMLADIINARIVELEK